MKILSLFDGISCARVALERAGIEVEHYYASEIDNYAIQISKKNYPNIKHIGSVIDVIGNCCLECGSVFGEDIMCGAKSNNIDLLIGGSPCQDLSIAKANRKGLDGERSGLFWEYVRILNETKPKYFILENVNSMPKEAKDLISKTLGVEPIMINASLVSAQNRKRLFWTNIPGVTQPKDRRILLKDILEENVDEKYNVRSVDFIKGGTDKKTDLDFIGGIRNKDWAKDGKNYSRNFGQGDRVYSPNGKSTTLSALGGGRGAKTGLYAIKNLCGLDDKAKAMTASMWKGYGNDGVTVVALTETRTEEAKQIRRESMKNGIDYSPRRGKELVPRNDEKANTITTGATKESLILTDTQIRKLTPIECERLQGLPDNYTEGLSNTQRYKTLGNAFNVDVVAHILSFIPTV